MMQNPLPPIFAQIEFLKEAHKELIYMSEVMSAQIHKTYNIMDSAHGCGLDEFIYVNDNDFYAIMDQLKDVSEKYKEYGKRFEELLSRIIDYSSL